jgi:ethanolamine ammonia-lyase large subunit
MPLYQAQTHHQSWTFTSLRELMAKASPLRSGDCLAGVAAQSAQQRVAAQMALAEVPLKQFLTELVIPYEDDDVSRLIIDSHNARAFLPLSSFTVGDLRNWLLSDAADTHTLTALASGLTPEMVAAVSKIMRIQDLILVASKCQVISRFRNTLGQAGCMSTRLQPNHPTDDPAGIAASVLDGLLYGNGDAVIGINPVSDSPQAVRALMEMLDEVIQRYAIPTQSCVLTHVSTHLQLIEQGAPVDLVFQSIAGTQKANQSFGINLNMLAEAQDAARQLKRGASFKTGSGQDSVTGNNVMYFETGQGSALSANAHHGVDQQTCEARAYAVARAFDPFLVNSVVGFIGPEYLYNGKQIIRAGLEDHFCGKLLGLPMGCDICYTNHADADQDDMDMLLTQLAVAGVNFIMGIPGGDDIMLNYQTTSFHDALYVRQVLGKRPAPEFADWLQNMGIFSDSGKLAVEDKLPGVFARLLAQL